MDFIGFRDANIYVEGVGIVRTSMSVENGKIGMLELDGQMMEYNSKFQDVIDQVVNYHIRNPKFKIDNASFLREILEGKRYEHDINLN